jgi:ribosomal protein S21
VPEIKRKPRESFESFMRRFTKAVQESGRLIQAKKIRFQGKEKSRPERRKDALKRVAIRRQKEYLKKIGKLKEETK